MAASAIERLIRFSAPFVAAVTIAGWGAGPAGGGTIVDHRFVDSTCAGASLAVGTGTGIANGPFGAATGARGSSRLVIRTPIGQAGGDANWLARRR